MIPDSQEAIGRRIEFEASPERKHKTLPENN
jgi:hypothetical protein